MKMEKETKKVEKVTMEMLLQQLEDQKRMIAALTAEKETAATKAKEELINNPIAISQLLEKQKERKKQEADHIKKWEEDAIQKSIAWQIACLKRDIGRVLDKYTDLSHNFKIQDNSFIFISKKARKQFADSITSPIVGEKSVAKATTEKVVKTLSAKFGNRPYKNCLEILGILAREQGWTLKKGESVYPTEAKKRLIIEGALMS
jgi:hypothetical protein